MYWLMVCQSTLSRTRDGLGNVRRFPAIRWLLVDYFALIIRDIVIFKKEKDLLAHIVIARLSTLRCAFSMARVTQLCLQFASPSGNLNLFMIAANAVGLPKNAQQRIFSDRKKRLRTRVALTPETSRS